MSAFELVASGCSSQPFDPSLRSQAAMTKSLNPAPTTAGLVLHWAARYDWLVWLLTHGRDRAFRQKLVDLAHLVSGDTVLDVGCGTGSLAIAAKRQVGTRGAVFGIDASPEMIARARSKTTKARIDVEFKNAVAEALPFSDAQFDVVLSTLMLHHLPRKVRQQCVRDIHRVLKPDGRVLIVDFAYSQDKRGFLAHFHRHGHVDPRKIVSLLDEAGLDCVNSGPVGVSSLQYVLAHRATR
jgi:ubiquinone/menaquinone biosynthesis C-methylase UbiE